MGARQYARRTQPKGHAADVPELRRPAATVRAHTRAPTPPDKRENSEAAAAAAAAAQARWRWRDAGRQRHPAEEREEASRDVAGAMTSTGVVGAPSTDARARGRPSGNAIIALSAKGPRTGFPPSLDERTRCNLFYFDRSRQRVSYTRPCYRGRNAQNSELRPNSAL